MHDLEAMNLEDLTAWLCDRLQERGTAAAGINRRIDEAPYELPLLTWQKGTEEFRRRMATALGRVLGDTVASAWSPEHFHNLATLVEEGEMYEVLVPLADGASRRVWDKLEHGEHLQMLAMRTLKSLRWEGWSVAGRAWLDRHISLLLDEKKEIEKRIAALESKRAVLRRDDFKINCHRGLEPKDMLCIGCYASAPQIGSVNGPEGTRVTFTMPGRITLYVEPEGMDRRTCFEWKKKGAEGICGCAGRLSCECGWWSTYCGAPSPMRFGLGPKSNLCPLCSRKCEWQPFVKPYFPMPVGL